MRAREFIAENQQGMTISIPINITIPAGGGAPTIAAPAGEEMPDSPVMVPPLQQEIELFTVSEQQHFTCSGTNLFYLPLIYQQIISVRNYGPYFLTYMQYN